MTEQEARDAERRAKDSALRIAYAGLAKLVASHPSLASALNELRDRMKEAEVWND